MTGEQAYTSVGFVPGGDKMRENDAIMIIRRLRNHWPVRKVEWLMAGFLSCWGLYVLINPNIWTNPATAQLYSSLAWFGSLVSDAHPSKLWGSAALLIGLARATALFINGAYIRTPLVRLLTSFLSAFIVTWIVLGLVQSGLPNPGLIAYSWLVIADLISAHVSAIDVAVAEKQRHELKGSRRVRSFDVTA